MQNPLPFRLGWIAVLLLTALVCLPFLWVDIPPLVDVPGHIAASAIAAAPPGSPLNHYYAWQWALVPNLGGEVLIHLIGAWRGTIAAGWWTSLIATALFTLGGLATIRALNPRGWHGLGWAMLFIYGFPWLWGFTNFVLAAGLSLLAFGLSVSLQARPGWRTALLLAVQPLAFLSHAVGGLILPLLVLAEALGSALDAPDRSKPRVIRHITAQCWPLAVSAAMLLAWLLHAPAAGQTGPEQTGMAWDVLGKLDFLMEVLRDQNFPLDVASAIGGYLLLLGSRWLGARWTWRSALPALALLMVYALAPNRVNGSEIVDVRLLSVAMVLALGLQDWSAAPRRMAMAVLLGGNALFLLRAGLINWSFPRYAASFRSELRALDAVKPGSAVLVLRRQSCANAEWRMSRLDNLGMMASPLRQAWTNNPWTVPGIHLLRSRHVAGTNGAETISPMIWDTRCPDADGRTVEMAIRDARRDRIDYVWLIDTGVPKTPPPGMVTAWQAGRSAVYRVNRQP